MQKNLPQDWSQWLLPEWGKPYFLQLEQFVDSRYAQATCYPPQDKIFEAFRLCPLSQVKVVLLGQDPYHEPGQAHGLSFSVPEGVKLPPSLRNIYKEIESATGTAQPTSGNLTRWARQGVLLLNATLTVEHGHAGAHAKRGWEQFTDQVISVVSSRVPHAVFMLWGSYAQKKASLVDANRHLVLQSAHPSPLSAYRGFFGNHHFSQANHFLASHGIPPIQW